MTREYTVQIRGNVNIYRRPTAYVQPDISVTMDGGCRLSHRRPAVTPACRHSTSTCARVSDHTHHFPVEQWSAASLTVAVS